MKSQSKVVIVTGGSRGIGIAIVKTLQTKGYEVYAPSRAELDLSIPQSIKKFCAGWNTPIYGLVNNAGVCKTMRLDVLGESDPWTEVIATNLQGVYLLTKGLVGHIVDAGRIVNISSQLGKEGRAGYGAYSASKFGLIGLTKCWAKELGTKQITVNAVCPGWVDTEMSKIDMERLAQEQGKTTEEYYRQICEPLELKRFTTPEEVAHLVSFLVSEEASGITGRDMLMHTIWNQE